MFFAKFTHLFKKSPLLMDEIHGPGNVTSPGDGCLLKTWFWNEFDAVII
jgi:hypothetical protein